MVEKSCKKEEPADIVRRFCPRLGKNVIMLQYWDENRKVRCFHYDSCDRKIDGFCLKGSMGEL